MHCNIGFISFKMMRTFVEIVNVGSFTQAALNLCMSQPAITSSMGNLEDRIGCNLFQRHGSIRTATPTKEGKLTAEIFHQIIAYCETKLSELPNARANTSKQKKEILVQQPYSSALSSAWVGEIINNFNGSTVKVLSCERDQIIKSIQSRTAAIGLVDGYVPTEKADYMQIATVPVGLVVSGNSELSHKSKSIISWTEIPKKTVMFSGFDESSMTRVYKHLKSTGVIDHLLMESNCSDFLPKFLCDQSTAAIMPLLCAHRFLVEHDMKFLRLCDPIIDIPIGFITPRGYMAHTKFHNIHKPAFAREMSSFQ